mmetsp:Transcript_173423/g.556270  ORF Transcript_173423/g.556270 Transcript_173423/m.556270 type:complete len:216 (-) Transcript_173423:537-1184(-)
MLEPESSVKPASTTNGYVGPRPPSPPSSGGRCSDAEPLNVGGAACRRVRGAQLRRGPLRGYPPSALLKCIFSLSPAREPRARVARLGSALAAVRSFLPLIHRPALLLALIAEVAEGALLTARTTLGVEEGAGLAVPRGVARGPLGLGGQRHCGICAGPGTGRGTGRRRDLRRRRRQRRELRAREGEVAHVVGRRRTSGAPDAWGENRLRVHFPDL